jgi:nucleotide-binding universal stress UspA family protein
MGAIVLATCLSSVSESAGRYALALAKATASPLHVVHASEPSSGLSGDAAMLARETARARRESDLHGAIESFCLRLGIAPEMATRRVLTGPIHDEIAAYAADVGADYVVVGTTAPRGLSAALLGSVADAIMRRSSAPVLIVRQDL